jgi:hypothetical protein
MHISFVWWTFWYKRSNNFSYKLSVKVAYIRKKIILVCLMVGQCMHIVVLLCDEPFDIKDQIIFFI